MIWEGLSSLGLPKPKAPIISKKLLMVFIAAKIALYGPCITAFSPAKNVFHIP